MHSATSQLASQILQKYQGLAPKPVINAVRHASASTGVDFAYLMEKAAAESSFQTTATAKTSSAEGLFQFIDSTWLEMVKNHGDKHGLGRYADAIDRDQSGKLSVTDAATRDRIMSLRKDARVSALLAAEYAAGNKAQLERKVGGDIGATELYFAHFMGASGASEFLNAMRRDDQQIGAELFPKAAKANKGVFYDPASGKPRTLSQVYAFFSKRFDGLPTNSLPGDAQKAEAPTMLADAGKILKDEDADTGAAFARPATGPQMREVNIRAAAPVTIASARGRLARTVAAMDTPAQMQTQAPAHTPAHNLGNTQMAGDLNNPGRLAPQLALMILDQVSNSLSEHLPGGFAERNRAQDAYSAWA